MRILYVHERFGALGGAESNAQITAAELGRRGHTIGLLHGPSTGRNEAAWNEAFPFRYPLTDGRSSAATKAALAEFAPDLCYVHKTSDLVLLMALVESGGPLVRMVHDHDIYCMRSYRYNYFTRQICTRPVSGHCVFPCLGNIVKNNGPGLPIRLVSLADKRREIALNQRFHRMIVVTEFMKGELLLNGFDPGRIVVHAPVPRMGDANLRSNFSDRNLIVYAGQIIRGKGVDLLLKALARVRVPFECVILGDGNQRTYCEGLAKKLGLSGRVHFKGFVPQEELKAYYRECSVVAVSSVWPEPIATIGLEVSRYALPVVAFDAGGIREWLHDGSNGFLVPWMDYRQFANRLEHLLTHKEVARRFGEEGLRFVNERFDFESYIEDLEHLFLNTVSEVTHLSDGAFPVREKVTGP
jgi:glycosyltransferase involved in cell wall biosynthesis